MEPGTLILTFIGLLLALSVHEAAHAWTASKLGDPTARMLGRVTLNPIVHIDPVGTILLPLVAFALNAPIIGWAKPVPVDTRYLKQPKRDFMWIALAGPASNLVLAILSSLVLRVLPYLPVSAGAIDILTPLFIFTQTFLYLNVLLAVFNMIPVPPLDGSNVVAAFLPPNLALTWDRLRPYGIFVLYGLMFTGVLRLLIGPPSVLLTRLLLL